MAFRLSIEDGPYVQTIEVRTGSLTIGRNPPQGLALSSPGLSQRHAIFRQSGDRVEMDALPTKIGVRLRGERVDYAKLAPGEQVHVGWAKITVVEITAEAAAEIVPAEATAAGAPAIAEPPTQDLALADSPAAAPEAPPAALEWGDEPAPVPAPRPVAVPRRAPVVATADAAAPPAHAATEGHAEFVVISRRAVRVLPWWGISIALHAVFLAVVLTLPRPAPSKAAGDNSTFAVTLRQAPPQLDTDLLPVVVNQPVPHPAEVKRDDSTVPIDTPDSMLPVSANPKGAGGTGVQRAVDPGIVFEDPNGGSPWAQPSGSTAIGVGSGGRIGSGIGTNLDEAFGKGDAGKANASAAGRITGEPFTRALVEGLRLRTNEKNVRVVRGDYDQGELVMEAFGLRHGWIGADDLGSAPISSEVRAIFYNCTGRAAPPRSIAAIEQWVKDGGFLFSSDWGVQIVVEKAFPGYIKAARDGSRAVMTPDETITFTIAPGKHPLLQGLPPEQETARWWLEESSIPFVIEKPDEVEVLVVSADLERKHGSKLVAVTFRYGKGRVVHVLGHMFQKEGNLRGAYAMQRLLLNFLYQAIRQ